VKLGLVAGAFNPATRAHLALADAARPLVDEVAFAIPRTFPHKPFEGASLERRVEMLRRASAHRVEITEGGLLIEIAREAKASRPDAEIYLVCGRDTAERIIGWEYEEPDTLDRMFKQFHLMVADRQGAYRPPDHLRGRIHALALPADFDEVSSSEVRRRIAAGEDWEHLVPESIVELVRETYRAETF
jgi:nicotinate-nucleotide adenylyltransferase